MEQTKQNTDVDTSLDKDSKFVASVLMPECDFFRDSCTVKLPGALVVKNLPTSAGDVRDSGSIPV